MNRVVVTGMGVVSALGCEIDTFSPNIMKGVSGVVKSEFNLCGKKVDMLCAPVKELEDKGKDRAHQIAQKAQEDSLKMSRILEYYKNGSRIGLFVGTATGCIPYYEDLYKRMILNQSFDLQEFGPVLLHPYHGIAQRLAEKLMFPPKKVITFNAACASSNLAVVHATQMIRFGILDCVIFVGAEVLSEFDLLGFSSLGILTSKAIRPFDAERDGIVLGEGAAALVLENYSLAKKRGADILAEIKGIGISNEAHKLATPDPEGKGATLCIQNALSDSGLSIGEIDYINAHGTGTVLNDQMETKAIKTVFKENAYKIPVSSSKSMLGHTRGASGAIEALICILAIQRQVIPPTINYEHRDSLCDLDYVPNEGKHADVSNVISNSFGFGGHCASIIISKYE